MSAVLRSYYKGPDHPMKLRLWSLLRKGLGNSRFMIPFMGTGWITVDERDYLQNQIFVKGSYETEVWDSLSQFSERGEIIWDIGANIGSISIRALLDTRIEQVHAFEPDPIHAEVLKINLGLNEGFYRIHQLGLGEVEEERDLRHATFPHLGGSTFDFNSSNGAFEGTFKVTCKTVDGLVYKSEVPAPTLMKIDVEGWELKVLKGARKLLNEKPPKAIVFEAACDQEARILELELIEFLQRCGYSISWICRPDGERFQRENYLAVSCRKS